MQVHTRERTRNNNKAHRDTDMRPLTEKQERLCQALVANKKLHPAQRLTPGAVYNSSGYSNCRPTQAVALEVRKPHIRARIEYLFPAYFEDKNADTEPVDEREWAKANLREWATTSGENAHKYASYLQKDKEAGMIEQTVERVILSPFLTEAELDDMRDNRPQDVVVAAMNNRPSEDVIEEVPVNIEETAEDE